MTLPPIFLLPVHWAAAAWLFLLCLASGRFLFNFFGMRVLEDKPERSILEILSGFILHSYFIWFLGLSGFCSKNALIAVYAAMSLALFPVILNILRQAGKKIEKIAGIRIEETPYEKIFWTICALAAFAIAVQQFISVHSPAAWRDDLSYHLYLPKAYLEMGRIEPPPFAQRQSFYHQIFNMIYLPAMALGGEASAKMINTLWHGILIALAWLLGKRMKLSPKPLAAACMALFASPGLLFLGQTAMTDLPAACFILGSLLALLLWREQKNFPLWIPALLAAFCLNKYTAWSYFLASWLVFLWISRKKFFQILSGSLAYGAFAAACLAPLAVYLWYHTGNPLYPLPFAGLPSDPIEEAMQKFLHGSKNPAHLAAHAWRHLFGGAEPDAHPLIALAPAALFLAPPLRGTAGLILAWSLSGYLLRFFAVGPSALLFRYILPSYSLWLLLAAHGWERAQGQSRLARAFLLLFFAGGMLAPCLIKSSLRSLGSVRFNLGNSSREEYLEDYYPSEGWETVKKINALPMEARVLALDHHFIPYYYDGLGSRLIPVEAGLLTLQDPELIRFVLKTQNITHVLFAPSRWHPVKEEKGVTFYGIYFGPHLPLRWWSDGLNLPFLKPVWSTPKATLFQFLSSE